MLKFPSKWLNSLISVFFDVSRIRFLICSTSFSSGYAADIICPSCSFGVCAGGFYILKPVRYIGVKMPILVLENGSYFLCKSRFRYSLYDSHLKSIRAFMQKETGQNQHFLTHKKTAQEHLPKAVSAPAFCYV